MQDLQLTPSNLDVRLLNCCENHYEYVGLPRLSHITSYLWPGLTEDTQLIMWLCKKNFHPHTTLSSTLRNGSQFSNVRLLLLRKKRSERGAQREMQDWFYYTNWGEQSAAIATETTLSQILGLNFVWSMQLNLSLNHNTQVHKKRHGVLCDLSSPTPCAHLHTNLIQLKSQ